MISILISGTRSNRICSEWRQRQKDNSYFDQHWKFKAIRFFFRHLLTFAMSSKHLHHKVSVSTLKITSFYITRYRIKQTQKNWHPSYDFCRIPFSTKLWFCIWEYEQLTTSNYLKHCLRESIPNLSNLVSMNLSYIATDQAVYLLSKHCPSLEDLCLDHSSVSDRCARFFCGYEKTSASQVYKYIIVISGCIGL